MEHVWRNSKFVGHLPWKFFLSLHRYFYKGWQRDYLPHIIGDRRQSDVERKGLVVLCVFMFRENISP